MRLGHPGTVVSLCTGWRGALLALLTSLLAACATAPAPTTAPGLADLLERAPERALFDALRAYDNGEYPAAEAQARKALGAGLANRRDQATAHKLLAFVACTSQRTAECEAAFRAARSADPNFALTRSEAGHPLWGPVWQRVTAPPRR